MRKYQRIRNFFRRFRQRKAFSFVVSFSVVVLLGVLLAGNSQSLHVREAHAQVQAACSGCYAYQVPANTGLRRWAAMRVISRQATASVRNAHRYVNNVFSHSSPVKDGVTSQQSTTPVNNSSTPTSTSTTPQQTGGSGNVFPYPACTWWANERYHQLHGIFVPWRTQANAWQWVARAYEFRWRVSRTPIPGSIIVLQPGVQGASWLGHVAVVERILSNGHVIASNMSWGAHPLQVTYVEFAPGPGVDFVIQ